MSTNYYARATLTSWSDTTGWSLTSGGPSASVVPTSIDNVIFDANSGAARSIALPAATVTIASLTMTGAPAITFTASGSNYLLINGGANLSVVIPNATFTGDLRLNPNSTFTMSGAGASVASLTLATARVTFADSITIGVLSMAGNAQIGISPSVTLNTGITLTVSQFLAATDYDANNLPYRGYLRFGGATIVIKGSTTGVADVIDTSPSQQFQGSGMVIGTGPGSGVGTIVVPYVDNSTRYVNLDLADVAGTAGYSCDLVVQSPANTIVHLSGNTKVRNLTAVPGSTIDFATTFYSYQHQFTGTVTLDGSGNYITFGSKYTTHAGYHSAVYVSNFYTMNYCKLGNVAINGVRALKSILDVSPVSGVVFVPDPTNFAALF